MTREPEGRGSEPPEVAGLGRLELAERFGAAMGRLGVEAVRIQSETQKEIALRELANDDREAERRDRRHRRLFWLVTGMSVAVVGLVVLFYLSGDRERAFQVLAATLLFVSGFVTGRASARFSPSPTGNGR